MLFSFCSRLGELMKAIQALISSQLNYCNALYFGINFIGGFIEFFFSQFLSYFYSPCLAFSCIM